MADLLTKNNLGYAFMLYLLVTMFFFIILSPLHMLSYITIVGFPSSIFLLSGVISSTMILFALPDWDWDLENLS